MAINCEAGNSLPKNPLPCDKSLMEGNLDFGLYFIEDQGQSLQFKDLSKEKNWKLLDEKSVNFGFSNSVYWLKFVVNNPNGIPVHSYLEIPYPSIDSLLLYSMGAAGELTTIETGDRLPFRNRPIPDPNFIFPLVQHPGVNEIYLRMESTSSMNFKPLLMTDREMMTQITRRLPFIWLYYGIMASMVVYNFILFILIREKPYLYYVLFAVSGLIFQLVLSGYAYKYLWPESVWWANNCMPFIICTTLIMAWAFGRSYARTKLRFPVGDRLYNILCGLPCFIMLPVTLSGSYSFNIKAVTILSGYFCLATLAFSIAGAVKGSREARHFVAGFGFIVAGVCLYVLKTFGVIMPSFITEWGIQAGSAFIVVVMSTALSDQINFLKKNLMESNETLGTFKHFADSSTQGLLMVDLKGCLTYANPGFKKIVGWNSSSDITGVNGYNFYKPPHDEVFFDTIRQVIKRTGHWIGEMRLFTSTQTEVPVIQSFFLIRDKNGKPAYFASIVTDITQNKRAEEDLELRVRKRTAELSDMNDMLLSEITERERIQAFLTVSEERYKALFENNPVGTIIVDAEASIVRFNLATEKMFIAPPEKGQILFSDFLGDITPPILDDLMACIETGASLDFRDAKIRGKYFNLKISPFFEGAIVTFTDITGVKKAEEYIHTLSQELIKVQEKERQRIARDLHDNVAQDLATLAISANTMFDGISNVPVKIKGKMGKFLRILKETITKVREISYDLQPPILEQLGLVQALYRYCEEFSESTGIMVDFSAAGANALPFSFESKINIYRIVQESLNNIRKHSGAKFANVKFVAAYPGFILRIEDRGSGFNVASRLSEAVLEKRMGIRSIEERVRLLGGKLTINSRSGVGTKIRIDIPLSKTEDMNGEALESA